LLYRDGFKKVIPIGCPTMYTTMNDNLSIKKSDNFHDPLVVYHRELIDFNADLLKNVDLLGQDFLDQAIFTQGLNKDELLQKREREKYYKKLRGKEIIEEIEKNGIFPKDFDNWLNIIGQHDFIFGPRLHGCIAAIIQGKPALMYARDLRVKEIAEFFHIPYITPEIIKGKNIEELYYQTDYTFFNDNYKTKYAQYYSFLEANGVRHNLEKPTRKEIDFTDAWVLADKSLSLVYDHVYGLQARLDRHITEQEKTWPYRLARFKKRIKDSLRYRLSFIKIIK
ncbi:MAG: polysaccharide pyruvyl transferase family protein, partial [bacterium]